MAVPELITALLDELASAGIEFIVVGGAAGVIHGAPVTTKAGYRAPAESQKHREVDEGPRRHRGSHLA